MEHIAIKRVQLGPRPAHMTIDLIALRRWGRGD